MLSSTALIWSPSLSPHPIYAARNATRSSVSRCVCNYASVLVREVSEHHRINGFRLFSVYSTVVAQKVTVACVTAGRTECAFGYPLSQHCIADEQPQPSHKTTYSTRFTWTHVPVVIQLHFGLAAPLRCKRTCVHIWLMYITLACGCW